MEINYQMLLFNFISTAFIYMIIPIIIAFASPHSQKQSFWIAIINSVIIYIGFIILYEVLGVDKIANIAPAWIYGTINYYILKKSSKFSYSRDDIYKQKTSKVEIPKIDLILVLSSFLILIFVCTFIFIHTIDNYKKQLEEKDEKIKELQDELYLYDYNDYIDSILKNSY